MPNKFGHSVVCKCSDKCRDETRAYHRQKSRQYRRDAGIPPKGERRCGTASGYNGGCRCNRCAEANAEAQRVWREKNPDKSREYSKRSYWKDPEKSRAYGRSDRRKELVANLRAADPEKYRTYGRRYHAKNRAKVLEKARRYRENNLEAIREREMVNRARPERRMKQREYNSKRRSDSTFAANERARAREYSARLRSVAPATGRYKKWTKEEDEVVLRDIPTLAAANILGRSYDQVHWRRKRLRDLSKPKPLETRACVECGKEFVKNKSAITCGEACSRERHRRKVRERSRERRAASREVSA